MPEDYRLTPEGYDYFHDLEGDYQDELLADDIFAELDFHHDQNIYPSEEDIFLDVPYVPTDNKLVDAIIDLAEITNEDVVYDLGCGDGRIVIQAALNRGAKGVGIDIDPLRIEEARENARACGLQADVRFTEEDLLSADFSQASVVTLYLLDLINVQLRPRFLAELQPGTRIVSHAFDMGDWKPDKHLTLSGTNLYKWVIPAKFSGKWQWQTEAGVNYQVDLTQKYQHLKGSAFIDQQPAKVTYAKVKGKLLEITLKAEKAKPETFVFKQEGGQLINQLIS